MKVFEYQVKLTGEDIRELKEMLETFKMRINVNDWEFVSSKNSNSDDETDIGCKVTDTDWGNGEGCLYVGIIDYNYRNSPDKEEWLTLGTVELKYQIGESELDYAIGKITEHMSDMIKEYKSIKTRNVNKEKERQQKIKHKQSKFKGKVYYNFYSDKIQDILEENNGYQI